MLFDLSPPIPPNHVPVLVAQATQQPAPSSMKTFTYCQDAEFHGGSYSAHNDFGPIGPDVAKSLGFKHKLFTVPELMQYKVTLLESPSHGVLREIHHDSHSWHFTPQKGYKGPDRVSFLVQGNGKQVRVAFNFLVIPSMNEQEFKCRSFNFGGVTDAGRLSDISRVVKTRRIQLSASLSWVTHGYF